MKNVALAVVAVLAVAAGIYAYTLSGRVSLVECHQDFQLCAQACDAARQSALNALAAQIVTVESQRMQDIFRCGPPIDDAARQCIADANARADEAMRRLRASADAAHAQCVMGCKSRNNRCARLPPEFHGDIDIACIGSGARCFKEVSETCQAISGACDDCGISLCGGGEWLFDSELPLTVTLVAAAPDLSNPRVLAASTPLKNAAVLNVPADIKLSGQERLYLGFDSTAKPKGAVKVRVHRDR